MEKEPKVITQTSQEERCEEIANGCLDILLKKTNAPEEESFIIKERFKKVLVLGFDNEIPFNTETKVLVSQYLFLKACEEVGISTEITDGKEEAEGNLCSIGYNDEIVHVSFETHSAKERVKDSVKKNPFSTIFLPWEIKEKPLNGSGPMRESYFYKYIRKGKFDPITFIKETIEMNEIILEELENINKSKPSILENEIKEYDLRVNSIEQYRIAIDILKKALGVSLDKNI